MPLTRALRSSKSVRVLGGETRVWCGWVALLLGVFCVCAFPQASFAQTAPRLSIGFAASSNPVAPDETLFYEIHLANPSSNTATGNFNVQVSPPQHLTVTQVPSGACSTNPCRYGGTVYYNNVSLAAGQGTILFFVATVDNSATNPPPDDGTVLTAELSASIGGTTLSASTDVTVKALHPMAIAIEGAPNQVTPGGALTYTIGYGNASNAPVAGQLKVALPAGATFVSASGGGTASSSVVSWDLGTIAAGYNDQRTLTVQVDAAAIAGAWLIADAQLVDSVGSQTLVRDSTADMVVASPSLLALSMNASPDPVLPGQTIVYTLHVANQSTNTPTGNFNINVTVPPSMTVTAVPSGACTTNPCRFGGIVYYNNVSLAAGASTLLSFTATVDNSTANPPPPSGAVLKNDAIAYVFGGVTASASVLVGNGKNLQLAMEGAPDRIVPGGALTYTISYGNAGSAAVGAHLSVKLPAGTTFVSASGGGTASGSVVSWDLGTIAAGYNDQRTLTVKVDAAATAGAWLVADAQLVDPVSGQTLVRESTADLVAASPSLLAFSMNASPDPVLPGQTIVYTLHVANQSTNTPTDNFNINVTVPPSMTVTAVPSGACTTNPCRFGGIVYYNNVSLAAGASTVLSFTATVDNSTTNPPPPSGAVLGNDAIAYVFGGVTANASVLVGSGKNLQLAIEGIPDRVVPGGALTYTISYGNAGTAPVSARLSVELPTGTAFLSASGGGTASGSAVSWDLGSIAAGYNDQRTLTVQIDAGATAGAWLVAGAQLVDPVSSQTLVRESTADLVAASPSLLALSLSGSPDPVLPGQTIVYTLRVGDESTNTATGNFNINVTIPPYMTVTAVPGGACTTNPCRYGGLVYYNNVNLEAGASTLLSFTATVDNSTTNVPPPSGTVLGNDAIAYVFGGVTANSSVLVGNGKDLQLAIQGVPDRVAPGSALTYTINYGNASSAAVGARLSVELPAGTTFVSASDGGTASGSAVSWDLGTIAAGYNGQRTLNVQVAADASAGLWLVANTQLVDPVSGQTLVRDSTADLVASQSLLALSMSASPNPILPGQTIVYTLHVANQSTNTATGNFNINVTVPPYMTVSQVPGGACTTNPCRHGGLVYYNNVSLAAGANTVISFTATVDNSTTYPAPPVAELLTNEAIAYVFGTITVETIVAIGGNVVSTPDAGVPGADAGLRDAAADANVGIVDAPIADTATTRDSAAIDALVADALVADAFVGEAGRFDASLLKDATAAVDGSGGGVVQSADGGVVDVLVVLDARTDSGSAKLDAASAADAANGSGGEKSGGCSCDLANPGKRSFSAGPLVLGILALVALGRRRRHANGVFAPKPQS